MSEEIVGQLLKGSKVIDREKAEIHTILQMIFWFLKPEEIHAQMGATKALHFSDGPSYFWTISQSGNRVFDVSLKVPTPGGNRLLYKTKSHVLSPPELDYVRSVRRELGVLVGGFEKTFPQLQARWSSFIDAAKRELAM